MKQALDHTYVHILDSAAIAKTAAGITYVFTAGCDKDAKTAVVQAYVRMVGNGIIAEVVAGLMFADTEGNDGLVAIAAVLKCVLTVGGDVARLVGGQGYVYTAGNATNVSSAEE